MPPLPPERREPVAHSGGFCFRTAMRFVYPLMLLSSMFLTDACVQYHYSPNFLQTPYVDSKGDGQVTAAVSGGPVTANGDFHASYSPIKHGTVMLNSFHYITRYTNQTFFGAPSEQYSTKGYFLEGAIGGYIPFEYTTAAIYTGWGFGHLENDYDLGRVANFSLQRFFVQPTMTFKIDWFRLGLGLRLVSLHVPSGFVDQRIDQLEIQKIQNIEQDSPIWFPEVGGNIGFHLEPITFTGNCVLVAPNVVGKYGFRSSSVGLALSIELEDLFKTKEKNNEAPK